MNTIDTFYLSSLANEKFLIKYLILNQNSIGITAILNLILIA